MNGLEEYILFVARGKSLEATQLWRQKQVELFSFINKKMVELGAHDVVLDRFHCRIAGFVFEKGVKIPHALTKPKGKDFYVPRVGTAPGLKLFKEIRDAAIPTYASLLDPTYTASHSKQPGFTSVRDTIFIAVPRQQGDILEPVFTPEDSFRSTLSDYYARWEMELIRTVEEGKLSHGESN